MNDTKEWPLVTVFTLVYNTGKYVVEALESVKANRYPNIQHIIIDDCSTDGTSVQLVQQWIEEHNYPCTFIKHKVNQGVCKSLNEILALTDGKYTLGVSDDLITETRFFDHVKILEEASEDVAIVFGDSIVIDTEGKILANSMILRMGGRDKSEISENSFLELIKTNFIPAMSATIRVSSLKKVGGYDENLLYEDYDLWLRLSRNYKFIFDDRNASFHRVHYNNMHIKMRHEQWERDKFHILLKHRDVKLVYDILVAQVELLFELSRTEDALNRISKLKSRQIRPMLLYCFLKLRIPFLFYRPFKFLLKKLGSNNFQKVGIQIEKTML